MSEHPTRNLRDPVEIFYVEDNPGDIRLTAEAFKSTERETEICPVTNGDDAIERLAKRAADDDASLPDVVLLDLNLPGKDGHAVLKAIRSDPRLEHLPVIILSSSTAPEDIHRSYQENANAYLTKPSDPDDFEDLVDSIEVFWFDTVEHPPPPTMGV